MSEIEPINFCTIHEYRRHIYKRKQAGDVSLGGLYMVLASLRQGEKNKEAIKFPIKMKLVQAAGLTLAVLTADLLDEDLQPKQETRFMMEDGISKEPNIRETTTDSMVAEMYIKDYDDYPDDGPGSATIEEELGLLVEGRELVGV